MERVVGKLFAETGQQVVQEAVFALGSGNTLGRIFGKALYICGASSPIVGPDLVQAEPVVVDQLGEVAARLRRIEREQLLGIGQLSEIVREQLVEEQQIRLELFGLSLALG